VIPLHGGVVLAVVLHLGGTPREADAVWRRMEPERGSECPHLLFERIRDHLAAVRA